MKLDPDTVRQLALKVSQYFRDFLESDFKKQQAPRRRIVLQTENGFRAGMRVAPYPELDKALWKLLSTPSGQDLLLDIDPRRFTREVSVTLKRIIAEQIVAIPESSVVSIRNEVLSSILQKRSNAINDPEAWVEEIFLVLSSAIGEQIVRPLIAQLDGPLRLQAYSVIDSLYSAEADLIARVATDIIPPLEQALARYLAVNEKRPVEDVLLNFLNLESVRRGLLDFFASFVVADAYLEFRDIDTYATTNEGLQLYLYVGTLKYRNLAFPILFVPVEVTRKPSGAGFQLKLINHLYANRRAMDFVVQELAAGLKREWISPIKERINYLTPEQSLYEIARVLFRQVATAVDLGGQVDLSSASKDASTAAVSMSSSLFLAAYERSDEALINDFEEIIDQAKRGGSALVNLFEGIVKGVLVENPVSISRAVEEEWTGLPMVERLVCDSPIPLNEEQRKVLLAIRKPEGKIVVVEGPPGTGKSHTITAIAADCAFNRKSCLVLSDKIEALDVVESKLADAMNRVRHDKDFPNPILRIGQQNANFKKLTASQTINQIQTSARAMTANRPKLERELTDCASDLKARIDGIVKTLGSISVSEIAQMHHAEAEMDELAPSLTSVLRDQKDPQFLEGLKQLESKHAELREYLRGAFAEGDFTPATLRLRVEKDTAAFHFQADSGSSELCLFARLTSEQVNMLSNNILEFRQLRMPVFGYLFRGSQVRSLEKAIHELRPSRPVLLKTGADLLERIVITSNRLLKSIELAPGPQHFADVYELIAKQRVSKSGCVAARDALYLLERIDPGIVDALLAQPRDDERVWPNALSFLRRWVETRHAFEGAPACDYVGTKTRVELLNTSLMNARVDERLLTYMENHRSDARALAQVVANRQKFPEDKFGDVRESFPVIIASIREFGEFMPLAPDIFDVVVIDEASQVSVAQALPALLRAKKVVVLGDSKQFSNVKSSNASNALNEKYRSDLVQFFERNVSREASVLQRLAMFDVKKSILEFCTLCASYAIMLRKHFRSYPELINYSSITFYSGQLQAIKIRSAPLDQVIRFNQIDASTGKVSRGTNEAEATFILERVIELSRQPNPPTVGVITPFREQQGVLSKRLFGHAEGRVFEDKLRLKVMTFDSCQGEEREIIFYSMVATPNMDALNYIFPVNLDNVNEAVEEKLKVQRLNVGFSRAQECVWFVHSMPIEQYQNAIGQALQHFARIGKAVAPTGASTDQSSPMEALLLEWLKQTSFIQANISRVEIHPQFPIGEYLRQLNPTYQHPLWRVDFLLIYQSERGAVNIVIEYDGFEVHFKDKKKVNVGNHERYLEEADVERQLTLESYGYRFLRVNRFNLGKDPVDSLSRRLVELVEVATGQPVARSIQAMQEQAEGLASRQLRSCSRCGAIRKLSAFFDKSLGNGEGAYGRVCMNCKSGGRVGSRAS
jgi:hypothetical protein